MANEQIEKAIGDGDVAVQEGEVTISAKASPTGKDETRKYRKLVAVTVAGMIALAGGKVEGQKEKPAEGDDTRTDTEKQTGAVDYFNYGYDLTVRSTERAKLASSIEGPEKAIAKAVKALVDNAGMAESDARELVIAQRKKQGLDVPAVAATE